VDIDKCINECKFKYVRHNIFVSLLDWDTIKRTDELTIEALCDCERPRINAEVFHKTAEGAFHPRLEALVARGWKLKEALAGPIPISCILYYPVRLEREITILIDRRI